MAQTTNRETIKVTIRDTWNDEVAVFLPWAMNLARLRITCDDGSAMAILDLGQMKRIRDALDRCIVALEGSATHD